MTQEHTKLLTEYLKNIGRPVGIVFYDKLTGSSEIINVVYEKVPDTIFITGDESQLFEFDELDLIDNDVLNFSTVKCNQLLVIKTCYFFDGHGSPDPGAKEVFVTDNQNYLKLNPETYYRSAAQDVVEQAELNIENLAEETPDPDDLYAQDGYNIIAYKFKVKPIESEFKAVQYRALISDYNLITS